MGLHLLLILFRSRYLYLFVLLVFIARFGNNVPDVGCLHEEPTWNFVQQIRVANSAGWARS